MKNVLVKKGKEIIYLLSVFILLIGDESKSCRGIDNRAINLVICCDSTLFSKLAPEKVLVDYDRFFKQQKQFVGYRVNPILDSVLKVIEFGPTNLILEFECSDGYSPTIYLDSFYKGIDAYLVYAEVTKNSGVKGFYEQDEKFKPYYLVWAEASKEDFRFIWPYGVRKITIASFDEYFSHIYPRNRKNLINGFELVRKNCMGCHSISGIGGKIGRDFNEPNNITEHWNDKALIMFCKKPVTSTSLMPSFNYLSNFEFNQIIEYLKSLKSKRKY